ncbi:hypothetical protein [Propionicicella superfundia]|uniref:hypothetical protein n=1 Tax=Propionicicella superfundia TaxID=348582 RepID=UPI0012EBC9B8|nr:hypothetical protein [Propionicicella superfundia]
MPITEYRISEQTSTKMSVATGLMVRPCMRRFGFEIVIPSLSYVSEMRVWGVWNVERARRNGFAMEGDRPEPTVSPEHEEARLTCWEASQADRDELLAGWTDEMEAKSTEVLFRAHDAAEGTDEFRRARSEYDECLRGAGLRPRADGWGSERTYASGPSGSPTAEEIRVAVIEAQCNVDLNITQRMGDLEASLQVPLIRENQAALNAERDGLAGLEQRLDEYIRTHQ